MALRLSASEARKHGIVAPKGKRPTPAKLCGAKPCLVRWSFSVSVPTVVRSEANSREHWGKKLRRKHDQWDALSIAFRSSPQALHLVNFPVVVTWTHIGRRMDAHENLGMAFKGLTDRLAQMLGIDDGDPRVTWRYEQRAGKPGVELRIEKNMEG